MVRHSMLYLLPACLYAGGIYALSNRSGLALPFWFPHLDKLIHAGVFGGLAVLTAWGIGHVRPHGNLRARWVIAVAVTIVYGMLDEWHQFHVPGRCADLLDVLADGGGAFIAAGVMASAGRRLRGRLRNDS